MSDHISSRVKFNHNENTIIFTKFAATKVVFYDTENNILLKVSYKENEPIPVDILSGFELIYKGLQEGLISFLCLPK